MLYLWISPFNVRSSSKREREVDDVGDYDEGDKPLTDIEGGTVYQGQDICLIDKTFVLFIRRLSDQPYTCLIRNTHTLFTLQ